MNTPVKQAEALYQIVPALYRTRDTGDLQRYFQACGLLLDQILATMQQRLADNYPDNPLDGTQACQDWVLPYFADLFRLADQAGLLRDPQLAITRMQGLLAQYGIAEK